MAKTNIKTFILSAIKPFIVSMRRYSEEREANIKRLVELQTKLIYQNETIIADLNTKILDLTSKINEYNQTVSKLATSVYTMEDVSRIERRSREVDYILGQVYDLIYIRIPDAKLPDLEDTWIPGDPVLTEAELREQWILQNGIGLDETLTPEQEQALQEYIDDYYSTRPRPVEPDDSEETPTP